MPVVAKELSAVEVRRLTTPGFYAVGGVAGLNLNVKQSGASSWVLRAMVGKKRRDIGLGSFTEVSLANARDRAREARDLIRQGIDPVDDRKAKRAALVAAQERALTFDEAARRFLSLKTNEFKNGKHAAQWKSTLTTYASPLIGSKLVADITLTDVLSVLEPHWLTKTETMKRLRGRIEHVLSWATVSGFREGDNPARWRGNLDAVLPAPNKIAKVKHHAAVSIDEAAEVFAEIKKRNGVSARALEFLILTAARSGEIRNAIWDEIDLTSKVWTISDERMKAKREHRVPLTPQAIAILSKLPHDGRLVFPSSRGGALSDMTLASVHKRMGRAETVHGWRSTFRDWVAERTEFQGEVAEAALAHVVGDRVEAAYRRGDLFDKRRKLMEAWAEYIGPETSSMLQKGHVDER